MDGSHLFRSMSIGRPIPDIKLFETPRSRSCVLSKGKVIQSAQYHILTSFSFHINQTNNSWDMVIIGFDLEKIHPKFYRKFAKITVTNITSPKSYQGITITMAEINLQCRSDPTSGSHFIAHTSKFLLINATGLTFGQGHRKVIQYISPDPYLFEPNI